ncbi:hypothetical protein [Deinococcus sp. QL22]|uniref:hypothetical protein n=1 Tax=Deinococcus sp. QL22 TaxID=2939437 RepID=UPI0020179ADD|nr:hypothetical protein [Deinococcus sp. QL22]UQN06306.1 hypothetical protein M1R55_15825 [Deinococcus sp. QL22]
MANTQRSLTSEATELGLDGNGEPVSGFRQTEMELSGLSLFFKAALQRASTLGVDDVGLYYVGGDLLLAGWVGDEVVKSPPYSTLSDEMAREFIQAVQVVHNRERRKKSDTE